MHIQIRPARPAVVAFAMLTISCQSSTSPTAPSQANRLAVVVGGRIADTLQRPVPDARVEIVEGALAAQFTTTDADGRFAISGRNVVAPLRLQITKDGYSPVTTVWRGRDHYVTLTALALVHLEGRYRISFVAADSCTQLPVAVRTRTYTAVMTPRGDGGTGFVAELGGAAFYSGYDSFPAAVANDAVRFSVYSWDAFNWWLEDQPIIEDTPAGSIALMGTAYASVVTPDRMTTSFDGSWSYCAAPIAADRPNFPPTCAARVECTSDQHRVLVSRE